METVIRIAIIYVFLMVALRLMGKREFSQLAPFELVTLLLIPEIVSQAMIREDFSLTNGVIGVSTLLSLVFLTSVAAFLSKKFGKVMGGEPATLVQCGYLMADNLAKERISPDEILSEMHKYGLETMSQVKWGVLEADGKITIVPWVRSGGEGGSDDKRVVG